ncbi:MAG: hypothetical protein JSS86_23085, partial [Cyanobacteria bacterium SZAS LIN-2]|nr:hypothetical protein [Cyanobacteria bacterium SZAS LIN-2]
MQQPGQPGQDINAAIVPPKGHEHDNAQQVAANGANDRLRQEAGLPPADASKETLTPKEPAADVKLRQATPGLDSVPTNAGEVNRNARAIDNMGGNGPVRVREATFTTADGQTLTGNVYPRNGKDMFMSSDGQKYKVNTSATGDISLVPAGRNGGQPLAVQDASGLSGGLPKPVVKGVTDATTPVVNPNAAAAAANDRATAAILQGQQQQQQLVQQALLNAQKNLPTDGRPTGQPIVPGVNTGGHDNDGGGPRPKGGDIAPAPKADQPVQPLPTRQEQIAQAIQTIQQQQQHQPLDTQPRGTVPGSGSAVPDAGRDLPKPLPVVQGNDAPQPNPQIVPPPGQLNQPGQFNPQTNIKMGDAVVHLQPNQPPQAVDHSMDRPFDKGMQKPGDKPSETGAP